MFVSNKHGSRAIPAVQGSNSEDKQFLDALNAYMTKELGHGLDMPSTLWVLVPEVDPSRAFSFMVKLHKSFIREATGFCSTLRFVGGTCTDPAIDGDEVSFTMKIQTSGRELSSPSGDGRGPRATFKFSQC